MIFQYNRYKKRNNFIRRLFVTLFLCVLISTFCTTSYATDSTAGVGENLEGGMTEEDSEADTESETESSGKFWSAIKSWFTNMAELEVLETEAENSTVEIDDDGQVLYSSMIFTALDRMFDMSDDGLVSLILNKSWVKTLLSVTQGAAAGLVVIYIYLHIIEEAQRSTDFSMEYWMKIFLMMGISIFMVLEVNALLDAVDDLGFLLCKKFSETAGTIDWTETTTALLESLGDSVVVDSTVVNNFIKTVVLSIVPWFAIIMCMIRVYAIGFGVMIELVIRKVFAPVAVADITTGGVRGNGFRFLTSYFGIYLRIACFYVIAALTTLMQQWMIANTSIGTGLAVIFVIGLYSSCGAMMQKVDRIVSEAL